jgi:NAD(P)-dependent dehydrogenase (short-subunit alcohol dehydrogenase family)
MTSPASRVAVVTGAGRGIGAAIARRLHDDGCAVVLADLDVAAAENVARAIDPMATTAWAMVLDVADRASVEAAFAAVAARWRRVDVLVNNAGIATLAPFLDFPAEVFARVLAVNVTGALLCGQAAGRLMREAGGGRIINIASVSGIRAGAGRTAYGTSKAALIGLTRQMAVELAAYAITANAIAPGPVETEMAQRYHSAEVRAAYRRQVPAGRYAEPEEIAAAASFLAAPGSGYVTGVVLPVDGGFLAAGMTEAS